MLRLRLLGAPAIHRGDRLVPLPSLKAQALLFYLAAEAGRPFTRGQIIALLWEESAEREGRNSLSTGLSRLRQALPVVPLRSDGDALAWDASAGVAADVHEIQALSSPTPRRWPSTRRSVPAPLPAGPDPRLSPPRPRRPALRPRHLRP